MRVRATTAQILNISDMLSRCIIRDPETGLYVYIEDWSDAKVADTIGCNRTHVQRVRRDLYGLAKTRGKKETIEASVNRLEELCKSLCKALNMEYFA